MSDGIVLYVARTPTGVKVQYRDYGGLADGLFSKGYVRYFYGEDAVNDAVSYAERWADKNDNYAVETGHNINQKVNNGGQ